MSKTKNDFFVWIKKNPLFKSKYILITDRVKYCEGMLKEQLEKKRWINETEYLKAIREQ